MLAISVGSMDQQREYYTISVVAINGHEAQAGSVLQTQLVHFF